MKASCSRGDIVRVLGLPPSGHALPPEVGAVFMAVVGKTLRVDEVHANTGCLALNVHADGSQADDWCQHTIWLEPESAILVSRGAEAGESGALTGGSGEASAR
jgi:hypothetical protein